ncbi:MAG TPA: hypothetical protein VGD11_06570 [Mycobacteriales bacterium]|jgi:hypothetical protein|nr:hypothetical protein [Mycobacterium sp.]
MRHIGRLCAVAAPVIVLGVALTGGPAQAKFTHNSHLTQACAIHENFPLPGVPARTWPKPTHSPRGTAYSVGVRYTVNADWALVLDYARASDPQWGFIQRDCLTDRFAYNYAETERLPDLRGSGGGTGHPVKVVPFDHAARTVRKTIHVGSLGTLRSAASSFVIGNVRKDDPFQLDRTTCGRHNPEQWIFGGAPNSGRWGYVQAKHLPACL